MHWRSSLTSSSALKRSQFAQTLIDCLAVGSALFLICVTAISIVISPFILFFVAL